MPRDRDTRRLNGVNMEHVLIKAVRRIVLSHESIRSCTHEETHYM